jgi:DNA-binding MarR family transcriptional regulator
MNFGTTDPAAEPTLDPEIALPILDRIERDPDVNQASLADQMDIAVGKVNWLIKRMIEKGYVKVKRLQRRKLRYIITPEGLAYRARLTINYIDNSLRLYRRVREQVGEQLNQVRQAGYSQVILRGDGDIADICRLSCLEFGISVIPMPGDPNYPPQAEREAEKNLSSYLLPILEVRGMKVILYMEDRKSGK